MNNKFDVSILIPTFHEEKNINDLFKEFEKIKFEIKIFFCFVDDSNNDLTINKINQCFKEKNFKILNFSKKSKISTRCKSSWDGFVWITNNINCKYIVEMDADLAQHPKDLNRGYEKIKKTDSDVLIFSKYVDGSVIEGRDKLRTLISYIYTNICKIIFSNKISDYSNSYRIYSSSSLKKLIKQKRRFNSPIQHLENILFYLKGNYKIVDTYCHYAERSGTSSVIKIKHLFFYGLDFIKCIIKNL